MSGGEQAAMGQSGFMRPVVVILHAIEPRPCVLYLEETSRAAALEPMLPLK